MNATIESAVQEKSLEASPLQNQVALSTPPVIDHMEIVRATAKRKTLNGSLSFTSKKGKQSLFSGVCAVVKSALGIPPYQIVDGKQVPSRLPEDEVKKIEDCIAEFWQKQSTHLLSFGEVTSARFDVPQVKFGKSGVQDARFSASISAKREAKDQAEKNFSVAATLAGLKRRLEMMDKSPSKYTGEQKREVMSKIKDCENYIAANQPEKKEVK